VDAEKLATRVLYVLVFWLIQSAAAITSLVRATPWSSMTSSQTILALAPAPP
jgi:hypothetical protein